MAGCSRGASADPVGVGGSHLVLNVWPAAADSGAIVSFDQASLEALTLAAFTNPDAAREGPVVQTISQGHPRSLLYQHDLPCILVDGTTLVTDQGAILESLGAKQLDSHFSPADRARIVFLTHYIREKLYPVLLYTLYVNHHNMTRFTKPLYGRSCPFPLGFVIPSRIAKRKAKLFFSLTGWRRSLEESELEQLVLKSCRSAMNTLSEILGDGEFLLGRDGDGAKGPCSADALLYSLLQPLYRFSTLPWPKASNYLRNCENLTRFLTRVTSRFFPWHKPEPVDPGRLAALEWGPLLSQGGVVLGSMTALFVYCWWARLVDTRHVWRRTRKLLKRP